MICQGRPVDSRFLTMLFIVFFTFVATGCAKSGATKWAALPVQIYADQSIVNTPQAQQDLQDAMTFWEQKAGKTLFDYKGVWSGAQPFTGTPDAPGTINANVIFFQNPWPVSQNVIGQTIVNSVSTEIQHAMIMINPDAAFCPGDCAGEPQLNSSRKNLTHELGHFLGLSHVQDVNNVMYPVMQPGGTLDAVTIDQVALMDLVSP